MKKNKLFNMPEKIFGISSSLIKLFLVPLVVIVFFLTSIGWLIMPRIESLKSLKNSNEMVKEQIKSTDEKRGYLLSIDQFELKQNADYLSSAVLPEKNSYLLVDVIRNIVSNYDYNIMSFSLSINDLKDEQGSLKVAEQKMATKLPLNIEVSGPSEKMVDLIKGLENSLPIIFIDNMETTKQGAVSSLKMSISSYYMSDNLEANYEKLTLNDLKLTKEESDLLTKISEFDKSVSQEGLSGLEDGTFVEYNRPMPF